MLDGGGGTTLIADVCIRRDAIGEDSDYYVIEEGKAGAERLLDEAQRYLAGYKIRVAGKRIPFVCGESRYAADAALLVADRVDAIPRLSVRPFALDSDVAANPDFQKALVTLATATYQQMFPIVPAEMHIDPTGRSRITRTYTPDDRRAAAVVLGSKLQTSSLLYLSAAGVTQSAGKTAARIAGVAAGAAVSVATRGLVPLLARPNDGWTLVASLVDLESGALVWYGSMRWSGDAADPFVVADSEAVGALLHDLVHRPEIR